jgi:hypothetical protein
MLRYRRKSRSFPVDLCRLSGIPELTQISLMLADAGTRQMPNHTWQSASLDNFPSGFLHQTLLNSCPHRLHRVIQSIRWRTRWQLNLLRTSNRTSGLL